MVGVRETPRQKMINLMYLVLMAMLALNVSSSVLEKYIYLDESLRHNADEGSRNNASTLDRIDKAVKETGNRPDDVSALDKANKVRERSKEVVLKLNEYHADMIEVTGGRDENNHLKGAADVDKVAHMMIVEGKGKELQKLLNEYAEFLVEETNDKGKYPNFALDGWDDPYFKKKEEHKNKDFSTIHFEHVPTAGGMATISQFESKVIQYEASALSDLARRVGAKDIKFDKIVPMVRPESKIVVAGTKYVADMFISASSSGKDPEMFVNGVRVKVEDGMGKVEFPVSGADNYDGEGLAEKTFKAEIKLRDTTFTQNITYWVAKPVIQIQAAAVQALYLNCGNEMNVQVPSLGSNYNPSFSTEGATITQGQKRGFVTVVPNARKVKLNVSSGGSSIGSVSFGVRKIPKPHIEVLKPNGKPVDERKGETIGSLRAIIMKAVPDESFASFLPKDARYRVFEAEVILARGSRAVRTVKVNQEQISLSNMVSAARSGDRIVVDIKKVQRRNFKNEVEDVNIGRVIKTIPLN